MNCVAPGCERPAHAKGFCNGHYAKFRRYGTTNIDLKFLRRLRHGDRFSPEWKAWAGIRDRCLNAKGRAYHYYGGRGIKLCERWNAYENFIADVGRKPTPAHTLERINNDGNYEPSNCRWATRADQARNRRSNHFVLLNGVRLLLIDAARQLGVSHATIIRRLKRGADITGAT